MEGHGDRPPPPAVGHGRSGLGFPAGDLDCSLGPINAHRCSMWCQTRRCGRTLDWGYPTGRGRKRNTKLTTPTALVLTGSAGIGDGF